MGADQYHEPPDELPAETRTFARLSASLTEEAEAIGWYEQRLAVESDREALAIMRDAQGEEFKQRDEAPVGDAVRDVGGGGGREGDRAVGEQALRRRGGRRHDRVLRGGRGRGRREGRLLR